jgi:hypothetical protein
MSESAEHLARLVHRLRSNRAYMAGIFVAYREMERLSDQALQDLLHVTPDAFLRLALCRCPAPEKPSFAADVRILAEYAGSDAGRIAMIIRQVQAVEGLRGLTQVSDAEAARQQPVWYNPGLLAAARDRDTEDQPDDGNEDPRPAEDPKQPGDA